jgi:hypothetical protein
MGCFDRFWKMRDLWRRAGLAGALVLLLGSIARGDAGEVRFNRDIRPIMSDTCFKCHGPSQQKANLRLDLPESATKKAKSGKIPIVPAKSSESEIIRRIFTDDPDDLMPPPDSNKVLTDAQKKVLREWVEQGAKYEKHWAFLPPVKPASPATIDGFIEERLRREGLEMSPEADRRTLIRRIAFALTGLPPTIADVETYLSDTSGTAYERMVERYLASPRFGEEMARHWLDVARYADTHGLHLDNERQMWLYRDWVIKAFNDNMPFDRFTIEQLAGDLLPNPTYDQLIATGFNRCNVTTGEGGSIEEEWYFRNAVDRTATVASAWMGLTAGCAVCHDHKFDPISAREFYSLYAFFYSAAGSALDGNVLLTAPTIKITTPQQQRRLAELDAKATQAQKRIDEIMKALAYKDPADGGGSGAADPRKSFGAWRKERVGKDTPGLEAELNKLLKQGAEKKLKGDPLEKLRVYYLQNVYADSRDQFAPLLKERDEAKKEREQLDASIPGSFVFKDADKPRDAFVMLRGQYDRKGEKVEPGTPAALPPLAKSGDRATRLDLAKWLVSPEHPLTARVAVNRLWQQLFGTGLVKTNGDFGSQGEPPSDPELLDWLAVTFREPSTGSGQGRWDTKAMVRLMVNSRAFRQSTRVTPELLKRDPDNRLNARGPRLRLTAEQIRDNALFVSGLMNLQMGGKGVNPYQPPNIWEPVGFVGSNTRFYKQDTGSALYRRSVYTFFKRTAPPPFMSNFDGPNREQSCTRRERSNTPLQALQLMNDVQHFEAARALAQRMLTEGGASAAERISFAFGVVLARTPEADELKIVEEQLNAHLTRYQNDPAAAKRAVGIGESKPRADLPQPDLAAYTLVANMILNLDETLNRN